MLPHKYLCEVDHPITPFGQPDTRQLEISFDIFAVTGAMQPSIDHLAGAHRSRCHIFRGDMDRAKTLAYPVDTLMEPLMPKRRLSGEHIPAMLKCHRRKKRISL